MRLQKTAIYGWRQVKGVPHAHIDCRKKIDQGQFPPCYIKIDTKSSVCYEQSGFMPTAEMRGTPIYNIFGLKKTPLVIRLELK